MHVEYLPLVHYGEGSNVSGLCSVVCPLETWHLLKGTDTKDYVEILKNTITQSAISPGFVGVGLSIATHMKHIERVIKQLLFAKT